MGLGAIPPHLPPQADSRSSKMENEGKDNNIRDLSGDDFSKIKIIFLAILSLGILGLAKSSWGTDWYVKKGATGSNNGTSWADAWNEMDQIDWLPVNPGDTIWLAGGTYANELTTRS
jgi:hypothetical protein